MKAFFKKKKRNIFIFYLTKYFRVTNIFFLIGNNESLYTWYTLLKTGGDQMKRSYFQTIYTTEKFSMLRRDQIAHLIIVFL